MARSYELRVTFFEVPTPQPSFSRKLQQRFRYVRRDNSISCIYIGHTLFLRFKPTLLCDDDGVLRNVSRKDDFDGQSSTTVKLPLRGSSVLASTCIAEVDPCGFKGYCPCSQHRLFSPSSVVAYGLRQRFERTPVSGVILLQVDARTRPAGTPPAP